MKENLSKNKFIFDWMGAIALIGGMLVGSSLIAGANVISIYAFHENLQYKDFYLVFANAAGFLSAIFAFDYFIVRAQTGRNLNFNFSPTNFFTYLLIFPMMLGMMFIGEFITSKIPISGPFFGEYYQYFERLMQQMTSDKATLILLAVVMAPIFEEIIFRGIIQKGLINKGVKPWKAILIAAIVFGLVHGNPWQFVGAVLLGFVLGLVYYKTKSLLLPILLHAFNNLCSAMLIFYTDTESFAETFKISEWMILGIGIILFSIFCYLFLNKYKVHYSE
jgi:membrane protease YdiL (CAAX protease family)